MDPSLIIAGIGAASGLYSSWKNRQGVAMANEKDRQYALQDWETQRKYNDPSMQMERLKAAGLNPNLAYGKGVTGNMTEGIRGTTQRPETYDSSIVGNALTNYQAVQMTQQKITNMENVNRNLEIEAGLKQLKGVNLAIKNQTDSFKKGQLERMADIMVQSMVLKNGLLQAQTNTQLTNNEIAQYMKEPNKQKVISQILLNRENQAYVGLKGLESKANALKIKAQTTTEGRKQDMIGQQIAMIDQDIQKKKEEITNLKYSSHNILLKGQAQQMTNRLRALGINEGDPAAMRMLGSLIFGGSDILLNINGDMNALQRKFDKTGRPMKQVSFEEIRNYKPKPAYDDPRY